MKYSRSLTSVVVFRPDPPRGGPRAGPKKVTGGPLLQESSSSDRKDTATNRMHTLAMIEKHVGRSVVIFGFIRKSNF